MQFQKFHPTYLCDFYRNNFNVFVSVGILYNHESHLRGKSFITSQIIDCAIKAKLGSKINLKVKNIMAKVDWGDARDYVEAMWLTLQNKSSDNFIISSGQTKSIQDFSKITFDYFNLDYKKFIFQKKNHIPSSNLNHFGNPFKINKVCGWKPSISFKKMILNMVIKNVNYKQNIDYFRSIGIDLNKKLN